MKESLVDIEDQLDRAARDGKTVKWITVISIVFWFFLPIAILGWILYLLKVRKLRNNQMLQQTFQACHGKTTKELRHIQRRGKPLDSLVAQLLIGYKSTILTLVAVVTGITLLVATLLLMAYI